MTLVPVIAWPLLVIVALGLIGLSIAGIVRGGERGVRLAWALRIVMIVLLIIVALRPQLPAEGRGPRASGGLELYFAIDTTSSMAAEDMAGADTAPDAAGSTTRLAAAKADIAAIAQSLPGAQYSLVAFDAAATQRVPLTTDASAIVATASVLTQEVTVYSRGSSIDAAVPLLEQILAAAKEKNPGNQRVLFYFGDGEQTIAAEPGSFESLAPLITGGGVIGYGTEQGGPMLSFDGFGDSFSSLDYIQDYTQSPPVDAISRIDETRLRLIAQQLGVGYTHRTDAASLAQATAGLDVGDLRVDDGVPGGPVELYWIFAIPLGLLLLVEAARVGRTIAEVRRRPSETREDAA
jgi:Ca-activated chloride channel family protein